MEQFIAGMTTTAFAASGIFFLKFWIKTTDRFFILFATSFWVLAVERVALVMTDPLNEVRPFIYLLRLAAFFLILVAVIDKNRKQGKGIDRSPEG